MRPLKFTILTMLCFALTTLGGCAKDEPIAPPASLNLQTVERSVAVSCPEADVADRIEGKRSTARPGADTKDKDGTPAVSRGATQKHIDTLEAGELRKNETINRLVGEIDRCRSEFGKSVGVQASTS